MAKSPKPATRIAQSAVAREDAAKIEAAMKVLGLGKPLTPTKKRELVGGTNVSDLFLELAAQIYDEIGEAAGVKNFNSDDVRAAIAFRKSQGPVLGAARALTTALEERILARFGGVGLVALDLYAELKVKSRRKGADPKLKALAKKLADEMARYRREAAARNKAEKAERATTRAENKAAKAGAAAGRKAAKASSTSAK